jgi:hypothetical protein
MGPALWSNRDTGDGHADASKTLARRLLTVMREGSGAAAPLPGLRPAQLVASAIGPGCMPADLRTAIA